MSEGRTSPVFYDPEKRRWRRFKWAVRLTGAVLSIIFGGLITSVLINPVLPSLGLPPSKSLPQARHLSPPQARRLPSRAERRFQRVKKRLSDYLVKSEPVSVSATTHRSSSHSELIGFYVNWDDTSFSSLKQNLSRLDKLIPEWLHLTKADGTISIDDPPRLMHALSYIREHRPDLVIAPLVNNFSSETMEWEGAKLAEMLANPEARSRAVQNLLQVVLSHGFAGISIDFENVPRRSQSALLAFMRELYGQFHRLGLEVSQSVPLEDPWFDYRELADFNDYLILMAYDEHASDSEAGPVASQAWYAKALRRRFAELPAEKLVIALGNYGYDWKHESRSGEERSFQEAMKIAQESEGRIGLDAAKLNPTFDYYDEDKRLHHVWFLDGVTVFNQLGEGRPYTPRGYALWRLGSEDPSIWPVFEGRGKLDRTTAESLRVLHYGYDLDYEGRGEVLKVTATPHDGARGLNYDESSGLILSEELSSYPSPYVISRWGGENKKMIALTFDDGPDKQYTGNVLDVLHQYQAPATFFIIGLNADLNPRLLQRIVNEGHEVGNHTFTHPNIASISQQQLSLEINATERLLESRLGCHTLLFRPPYAEDVEPETPDQVKPLLFTGELGYYTIGMQIDPNDWRNPGVDQIVKATINGAVNGEGHVVLLHDGGGDRSQTLAALPQVITGLRERGFELVGISRLLGLTREAVMPPVSKGERLSSGIDDAGFLLIHGLSSAIHFLFLMGIVLGILRLLFVGSLAVANWWKSRHSHYPSNYLPSVSVIVPAYNEEKVICRTLQALLTSDYPNFDILVVDDGSTDGTYQRVRESFGQNSQVRVYGKPKGGKAQALNYAIHRTQAELIVILDADTLFHPEAIRKLARHFADPRVGAVAGNAKVGNRINLLTQWQALEYITSQNLDRRAFELLNCISVVPGAIGAWRRDLILEAGGFAGETLAEDADLTLTILRTGYQINYEEEAIAFTEAPDTVGAFLKQRFRWMYGTLQAVWKHRGTLLRARYGTLGMFAIPNVLIFQILFPLVSPMMDLLMLWSFGTMGWQQYQHPADSSGNALQNVLFYYALFLVVDFLAAAVAFLLERGEDWTLLAWLLLQRFFYRQLMYYVAIKSTVTAIRGTIVGWGKLERKATVQ